MVICSQGSGFFSHLLNDILDEAEQVNKKVIVIYISNPDQILKQSYYLRGKFKFPPTSAI